MTVPGSRIWASSSAIPQSQNTAPVLEFRCLYTPDLRRKQKRWQDGRLKYHTFNKRIMVYDDRSNFVGDSHWREDHTFGEGEEVELERCGILVEVSECVGTREQDLTSLLNKALKDRQETAKVRAVDFPPLRSRGSVMRAERVGPLHAESTERSAKRRKPIHSPPGKNGYAQNLTGVTLALSRTCSTPTPLRYDPEWLQTMKQPIEEIDMSSTAGLSQTPQGRPVAIRISGTNALSIQTRTTSKNSSSASVESGYAPNITGTALVLATKTLMSRRPLPGSGRVEEATSQSGGSGTQAITIEEDEFMDIDVYDKENLHVEKATAASFPAIELVKHSQKKSSPDLTSHQPLSEVYQLGRSLNPLRIKTLPKRKLFLAADPPSRPPSFNEPSGGIDSGATCPSASPRAGGAVRPPVIVSRVASITETRPLNMDEHRSSSPVSIELDHHGIDVLLTRKLFGKPSVAGELQGHQQPCNEINKTTQSAKESRNTVGSKGQRGTLSSLIPAPELELVQKNTQNQRQLSTLHSNRISEIEKAHISRPKNFSASPRLMKSFSEGTQANQLNAITILTSAKDSNVLRPSYHIGRDLPTERDVPAKPACAETQCTDVARRENKQAGCDEHAMPAMIVSTEPIASKSKMTCENAATGRDQGPWSREAFDLFDWRPGAATTCESLAAG